MIFAAKWIWRNHSNKAVSLVGAIIMATAIAGQFHFVKGTWLKISIPLLVMQGHFTLTVQGDLPPGDVAETCCNVFVFGMLLLFAGLWSGFVIRRQTYRR